MADGVVKLYGTRASYFTGKSRAYLIKKAIPFEERLPSDPHYREVVLPAAENHRIPAMEMPDGTVVQDTTAIIDYLEPRYPAVPAIPSTPCQGLAARLFEVFADEFMLKAGLHYRWNFLDINRDWILREFGRAGFPEGPLDEILAFGQVIADKMSSYLPSLGIHPESTGAIEESYLDLLALMNDHFLTHPYLLGGSPTLADYGFMGPLYAHLGRDPMPVRLMQQKGVWVFNWVERMNTPGIASPEFAETSADLLPDDMLSESVLSMLKLVFRDFGPELLAVAERYNDWVGGKMDMPSGAFLSDKGLDSPSLGMVEVTLRGARFEQAARTNMLWMFQRVLDWYRALPDNQRAACDGLIDETGGRDVMSIRLKRGIDRVRNRLAFA